MIQIKLLDRFLADATGQALREGTRFALDARVEPFVFGDGVVATVVRGHGDDYEVRFRAERGRLAHECTCPSWRDPCKHRVAAAEMLRQGLRQNAIRATTPPAFDEGADDAAAADAAARILDDDPERAAAERAEAERAARDERQAAATREPLRVHVEAPGVLAVRSPSSFTYLVEVRGGADGPHGCDCPDFEANRLHTCKHVERARAYLRRRGRRIGESFLRAANRPRVYLHFGQAITPRLLGRPRGGGAETLGRAFDERGIPRNPPRDEPRALRRWLDRRGGGRVEPNALAWLDVRIDRTPNLGRRPFRELVPALGGEPYPYQWVGAEFLARRGRALLADEMGLGKTVQAIIAAAALRRAKSRAKHVTIVCPASLRGGWRDEISRWLGEDAVLLEGPARTRKETIASRPGWLITHYEQVLRDHAHHAAAAPDLLIIDEAQRAKGIRTKTARTLKAIGSRHVFALTGTPLENRLEEAYAVAQLIDQRLLPPLWQLDRDHFVRAENGRAVELYRDLGKLRSTLAPAFLRRRKEDVALELPPRVQSISNLPMHDAVVDTYEEMMKQARRIARKRVLLPADIERMMKLLVIARRCCNGPHMLGDEVDDNKVPKLAELTQALRDLCLGERRKAVVFSEWTDMTDRVESLCRGLEIPVFHLHGGVNVRKRPAMIRSFGATKGPAVFISTDAGGVGLNLQAADVLINLDLPWNPAKLEQRIARVHRIGSKNTVRVLLLVCRGSIEEKILLQHDTKRNVFENLFADQGDDVIEAPGGSGQFKAMIEALVATAESIDHASESGGSTATFETDEDDDDPATPSAPEPSTAPRVDPAEIATAIAAVAPALPADHRSSLATVFRALADALEQSPE